MAIEYFDMDTPLAPSDARADDILAIHDLWGQIGDDNADALLGDPEGLRTILAGLDYLVLRRDDTPHIIGAVSVMDCQRGLAKIDSLAVHPAHHRHGYGRQLVERALKHCKDSRFDTVTATAMPSSLQLFESCGFEPYERHESGNTTVFLDL